MKLILKIYDGDTEFLRKELSQGVYRVGRSSLSDIVLPHDSVSRSHVEIRVTESSAYITNMAASGKVKLNSELVETAELKDGDEMYLGAYRVLVQVPAADALPDNVISFSREKSPASESEDGPAPSYDGNAALKLEPEEPVPSSPPALEEVPQYGRKSETVVEVKPVVAKLLFTEGPKKGQELFLEAYEVTMGRSKKADIYIEDTKLSRVHAKITRVGMGYRLVDLNSRNGTFVNGMRVLEHPLGSFDEIQLGHTKIQFIISDLMSADVAKAPLPRVMESTKSVQMDPNIHLAIEQLRKEPMPEEPMGFKPIQLYKNLEPQNRNRLLIVGIVLLALLYFMIPNEKAADTKNVAQQEEKIVPAIPSNLPKEFSELPAETQRAIEGHYNAAVASADRDDLEQAVLHLRKIHEMLPYYKKSRELFDDFAKRLKERQILEAQERAKKEEAEDLEIYIDEGKDYLREGDFERAAESFTAAINMEPNNATAIKGLKASQMKIRDIDQVPPDRDPELDKRKKVSELFEKAIAAFSAKAYQEAIDYAEEVRAIELKGDTKYLNDAKQIIDRARLMQKEEFEPFLVQAKEKFAEGDYNGSRDLCEEMVKRDPAYDDAQECLIRAKKQLNKLAKEAYTHGYVLESMNKIEEAKQFWNRAKTYTRKGDEYYDKIMKKLEQYQ